MATATMMPSATKSLAKTKSPCLQSRISIRPLHRQTNIVMNTFRGRGGPQGSSYRGRCGPVSWQISDSDRENLKRMWNLCVDGTADDWGSMFSGHSRERGVCYPLPVDAYEDEDKFIFKADVPGLTKDEVKVQISQKDRTMTISGERKADAKPKSDLDSDSETPEWRSKRVERRFGQFERKFKLPEKADAESVSARVVDGVLTLEMRKYKNGGPDVTTIPISDS